MRYVIKFKCPVEQISQDEIQFPLDVKVKGVPLLDPETILDGLNPYHVFFGHMGLNETEMLFSTVETAVKKGVAMINLTRLVKESQVHYED